MPNAIIRCRQCGRIYNVDSKDLDRSDITYSCDCGEIIEVDFFDHCPNCGVNIGFVSSGLVKEILTATGKHIVKSIINPLNAIGTVIEAVSMMTAQGSNGDAVCPICGTRYIRCCNCNELTEIPSKVDMYDTFLCKSCGIELTPNGIKNDKDACNHSNAFYNDDNTEKMDDANNSYCETLVGYETKQDFVDPFDKFFDDYLERAENISSDANATESFMNIASEMRNVPDKSRYYFLAAFAGFLFLKSNYNESIYEEAIRCIKKAGNNKPEYVLLLHMLKLAGPLNGAEELLKLMQGTKNKWFNDPNALFKREFMVEQYEFIVFLTLVNFSENLENTDFAPHWEIVRDFDNYSYRMFANAELYNIFDNTDDKEAEKYLLDVIQNPKFSIYNLNGTNFYDKKWLECYIDYGNILLEGEGHQIPPDAKRGMYVLREAAKKATGENRDYALYLIGAEYESGAHGEQNMEKAIKYYNMISDPNYVESMKRAKQELEVEKETNTNNLGSNEEEYLEELKACMENGEISNGERRLLNKLRIKLGISETRATELEASLAEPQLTEEEQEYLKEYRECFTDGGKISA